jgi:hypothetical protein
MSQLSRNKFISGDEVSYLISSSARLEEDQFWLENPDLKEIYTTKAYEIYHSVINLMFAIKSKCDEFNKIFTSDLMFCGFLNINANVAMIFNYGDGHGR